MSRAERALLRSLGGGDEAAFWALWEQYRRHLYAVCLRQMSGDESEADDAVSRSMMVARDRLPEHAQRIENLEAWLTRLTCNVCLDIHRERRRLGRGAINIDADGPSEAALMVKATPESAYYSCEVRIVLDTAMAMITMTAPAWMTYEPKRRRPRFHCACAVASRIDSPVFIRCATGRHISASVTHAA